MRQDERTNVKLGEDAKKNRAHHRCFSDGAEAVDKNVAGYVHRWTCRREKDERIKITHKKRENLVVSDEKNHPR